MIDQFLPSASRDLTHVLETVFLYVILFFILISPK